MLRIQNGRFLTDKRMVKGELWCHDGKIVPPQKKSDGSIDAGGLFVVPGFIDLQINGAYGVDFSTAPEHVGDAARKLVAHGVTSFLPTVVSCKQEEYPRLLRLLQPRKIAKGASLLGIHLEGPFFNPLYRGCHAEESMAELPLSSHHRLESFYGTLAGVRMITLAPEQPQMLEVISLLKNSKVIVAMGHSAATLDVIKQAQQSGARLITHLFNAMPPFHHRQPGFIDAALLDPKICYTLVCDGVHVSKQAIQMAWKLNPEQLIVVSDAMEGLGLPAGRYTIAKQAVQISDHGAYLAQSNRLAGSTRAIDYGVRFLKAATGCSLFQAIRAATFCPAKLLGLEKIKGSLAAGADADFLFLDEALQVRATFVGGEQVYPFP